ncbi:hypothetical protein SDC9_59965 [bioreactor metagenome]|uniref:Uncharacterized protein n=1 Tax=bioreactor metagenome TaxID=1076179 RepID=A0A644XCI2_9ZZZZ
MEILFGSHGESYTQSENGSECVNHDGATSVDHSTGRNKSESVVEHQPFIEHVGRNEKQTQKQVLMHFETTKYRPCSYQQTGRTKLSKNQVVDFGMRFTENTVTFHYNVKR